MQSLISVLTRDPFLFWWISEKWVPLAYILKEKHLVLLWLYEISFGQVHLSSIDLNQIQEIRRPLGKHCFKRNWWQFSNSAKEDHTASVRRKGCQLANTPWVHARKPSIISKVGSPVLKKKKLKKIYQKPHTLKHPYRLCDHVKDKCILACKDSVHSSSFLIMLIILSYAEKYIIFLWRGGLMGTELDRSPRWSSEACVPVPAQFEK